MPKRNAGVVGCLIGFLLGGVSPSDAAGKTFWDSVNAGLEYLRQGQTSRAASSFTLATRVEPKESACYLGLAMAATAQRDWAKAMEAYKAALALEPRDALAYNGLGIVYFHLGQVTEAARCFELALQLDDKYAAARVNLAYALCAQNKPPEALAACEAALNQSAEVAANGFLNEVRGLALLLEGRYDESIGELLKAWQAIAGRPNPYLPLSRAMTAAHAAQPIVQASPLESAGTARGEGARLRAPKHLQISFDPRDGDGDLKGTVTVTAALNGLPGVKYVGFTVGGKARSFTNSAPYQWRWNTTFDNDGERTLVVKAHGVTGEVLSAVTLTVRVRNGSSDGGVRDVELNGNGSGSPPAEARLSSLAFNSQPQNPSPELRAAAVPPLPTDAPPARERAPEELAARERMATLLQMTPQLIHLRYLLGKAHQGKGAFAVALSEYVNVYAEQPNYLDVHEQILQCRAQLGQPPVPFELVEEPQSVPSAGSVVALTFDDGPRPGYTEPILRTLREHGVRATFFLVGRMAAGYPDLVRAIADDGHEIASHSFLHFNMKEMTTAEVERELLLTEQAIQRTLDARLHLFRPPGGHYSPMVRQGVANLGYKVIFWTANITSFPLLPPEQIADRLAERVGPGGIILLHNGKDKSMYVLPRLLWLLKERGYRIVTVSELLALRNRR